MVIGDSKTDGAPCCTATGGYQPYLLEQLIHSEQHNDVEIIGDLSNGGWTTATAYSNFAAFAATMTQDPDFVLINLGTNDLADIRTGSLVEAAWAMDDLLDAIHAEWPSAQARLMRVIRTDYTTEQDLLDDTWIPNVLASRSAWASLGPDERVFLPPDLGDTTHPTQVGYQKTGTQWRWNLGY